MLKVLYGTFHPKMILLWHYDIIYLVTFADWVNLLDIQVVGGKCLEYYHKLYFCKWSIGCLEIKIMWMDKLWIPSVSLHQTSSYLHFQSGPLGELEGTWFIIIHIQIKWESLFINVKLNLLIYFTLIWRIPEINK